MGMLVGVLEAVIVMQAIGSLHLLLEKKVRPIMVMRQPGVIPDPEFCLGFVASLTEQVGTQSMHVFKYLK